MKNINHTQTLNVRFEKLKQLRGVCIRLEMHYYRNRNIVMIEVMQERLYKVVCEIEKLSIILKPLNAIALAEYKKSSVHQFLMNSKGMNGKDILINMLTKSDLKILTQP